MNATSRDIAAEIDPVEHRGSRPGRMHIAVIGIDRYDAWGRLHNAVNDANGVLNLFLRLGFELVASPLVDETATGEALRRLVTDDLCTLGPDDSLVLFFAGHGHTVIRTYSDGTTVKDGYIIPVDGAAPGRGSGTWLRLDSWLSDVTRCPARHILVILDACHSGIALGSIIRWRGNHADALLKEPLESLRKRRSRRIITSALDDQLATDGGPVPGHSLFTGCLIEALSGGLTTKIGDHLITGSEIGQYVQRRVSAYPNSVQTPDFGSLELDDRGELTVCIATAHPIHLSRRPSPAVAVPPPSPRRSSAWARRAIMWGMVVPILSAVIVIAFLRGRQDEHGAGQIADHLAVSVDTRAAESFDGPAMHDAGNALPDVATAHQPTSAPVAGTPAPSGSDTAAAPTAKPLRQRERLRKAPIQQTTSAETTASVHGEPPMSSTSDEGDTATAVGSGASPSRCTKAMFAAVYEAPAPPRDVIRTSLRDLKLCRDAGLVTRIEFERYQSALVARL
jgi:uncharacterized caspase-like protein